MLFYSDLLSSSPGCTPSTSTCQHEEDLWPLSQRPVKPGSERQIDWVLVGMQSVYTWVGACAIMCVCAHAHSHIIAFLTVNMCERVRVCGWRDVCISTWTTNWKNSFSTNVCDAQWILYVCMGLRLYVFVLCSGSEAAGGIVWRFGLEQS